MILPQMLDCPSCCTPFDHVFSLPGVDTLEEISDPPSETVKCPACSYTWDADYTGWSHTNEA